MNAKTTSTRRLLPAALILLTAIVALVIAGPTTAESAAELLEQGIYTEETVGDLAGAIEIYTRVVEDAGANRPHVAQAQFRLAMCHLKRGSAEEARGAFHRLIRDYPEQEELVSEAREQLAAARPALTLEAAPWQDGEALGYRINLATGKTIGALFLRAEATEVGGVEAWQLEQRKLVFVARDNHGVSRVFVDRHSHQPLHSIFRHGVLGDADATYGPDGVDVVGAAFTTRLDGDRELYDNEQSMHLLRMLPLAPGYKTQIRFLPIWTAEVADVDVEVVEIETCKVPAGEFECYKLALDVGKVRQTLWLSTGPERYPVKLRAEGVLFELAGIGRFLPGEPVPYRNPDFGFSGTLPAGWLPFEPDVARRPRNTAIRLLDPDHAAVSSLEVDRCPKKGCPTLEETAEGELAGARKRFDAYSLREASWIEREIDGRPAISFIGDYQRDGKSWVQYRVYTLTDDTRFELIFRTPADLFEELRSAFDSVAENLETAL